MAFRTWVKLLLATLGVAALAGASQLGLAYGLGIVRLTRVLDVATRDQWTAQLAWVAWFAMVAAAVGASAGALLLQRWQPAPQSTPDPADTDSGAWPTSISAARPSEPRAPSAGTTIALAVAAGIGAAVVVPLTMQPARTAQVAGVDPVVVIGICASLGAILGIFAACAAVAQSVVRWNLATVGVAVWVLAIVSVSQSLASNDPPVRLGVFDAGFLSSAATQRTALLTMPAIALLAGAALGWQARRQERSTLTIALAGLAGPALLTLAYLIAGPGSGDDRYQIVPYWAAMTATGAGVLGSVLAAVLRRGPGPSGAGTGGDDDGDGDEPTADLPQLPKRRRTKSQIAAANAAPGTPPAPPANAPPTSATFGSAEPGATASGRAGSPGDGPTAGMPRPADTGVFDSPTGQIRPAPSGRGPRAAPWSPTASAASGPLAPPGGVDAFAARSSESAARHSDRPGSGNPGGGAHGEYAGQEPTASRSAPGRAQHAAPEQAHGFAPPVGYPATSQTRAGFSATSQTHAGYPATSQTHAGFAATSQTRAGFAATGQASVGFPATGQASVGFSANDQTSVGFSANEPADVFGGTVPPPPRGGALSRGLRSLGRARPIGTASVDLPLSPAQSRASTFAPTNLETGAHAAQAQPANGAHSSEPAPKGRRRSRREPLVSEPPTVSTPLLLPPTHSTAQDGRFGSSAPVSRPDTQLDEMTESTGRHGAPADEVEDRGGRRFGLKKRKDNNDYVDWVSGLGND